MIWGWVVRYIDLFEQLFQILVVIGARLRDLGLGHGGGVWVVVLTRRVGDGGQVTDKALLVLVVVELAIP